MLLQCLVFSGMTLALIQPTPNLFHFGQNITISADQQVQNVTCILCSIDVRSHLPGHVRAFAGNVVLNGTVSGNVLVLGGNVSLGPGAVASGSVTIIGGRLLQDPTAKCNRLTTLPPIIFLLAILLICVLIGFLIRLTKRSIRGPIVYPPLPRL